MILAIRYNVLNAILISILIGCSSYIPASSRQISPDAEAEDTVKNNTGDTGDHASPHADAEDPVKNNTGDTGDTGDHAFIQKIPTKFYLFKFEGAPNFDSKVQAEEIRNLVEGVNSIWVKAGIQIEVLSIESLTVPQTSVDSTFAGLQRGPDLLKALARGFPTNEDNKLWRVGVINRFPDSIGEAGGVYIRPIKSIIYADFKNSHEILAHEFGHSFGLDHTSGLATNLMQVGGSGDPEQALELTAEQVEFVKNNTKNGPVTQYTPYVKTGN